MSNPTSSSGGGTGGSGGGNKVNGIGNGEGSKDDSGGLTVRIKAEGFRLAGT